jgi:heat shock protein HtpX
VCCTQGILQVLSPDELRGVLAHELSHVRNHDILISSVAAAVALGIMFVARLAMFGAIFGGGRGEEGNVFGLLAMMILAPIAAMFVQMALSRSREYQADASGAHLLHDGEPLARALEKIEAYAKQVPMNVNPAEATAYIINPLTGRRVSYAGLFSTHPPTTQRIARLRGHAW